MSIQKISRERCVSEVYDFVVLSRVIVVLRDQSVDRFRVHVRLRRGFQCTAIERHLATCEHQLLLAVAVNRYLAIVNADMGILIAYEYTHFITKYCSPFKCYSNHYRRSSL